MRSARLTALATTSTTTSPGPATGSGTSTHSRTSGPPGSRMTIACMGPSFRILVRMPPGPLTLDVDRSDESAPRLGVAGEIDLATAPAPDEAATALPHRRPPSVTLDHGAGP